MVMSQHAEEPSRRHRGCRNGIPDFDKIPKRNISAALGGTSCIQSCSRRIPGTWRILLCVEAFHVFNAELEVEHIRVFLDPRMSNALGENHKAFLQAPTEQDLCRGLAVFGRERLE